ncbi:DUF4142 domain-containing protein [Cellvibrio mixtus]|uniref:DUF4142 domain-containing protein n=1 Tax=Cellvibrio mixtus TaxID=39650 RepID=UPI000586DBD5|nr:DUF4142 domain-containing protein [Cellvibrio mixtus]
MKKVNYFLVCAFWLMAPVMANAAAAEEFVTADFIRFVSAKNMSEMAAAKLALKTSSSPDVQAYAQRRLEEQVALLASLQSLAQQQGILLDHQPRGAYVFIRKGETFDTAYTNKRAAEVKRMVRIVRKATLSENPAVRDYAEQTLPALMQHWYQLQQLVATLNNPVISADSRVATR